MRRSFTKTSKDNLSASSFVVLLSYQSIGKLSRELSPLPAFSNFHFITDILNNFVVRVVSHKTRKLFSVQSFLCAFHFGLHLHNQILTCAHYYFQRIEGQHDLLLINEIKMCAENRIGRIRKVYCLHNILAMFRKEEK